jgi:hypothetical protein
VFKYRNFLFLSDFVKVIHIELSNKRWELPMFEVFGQNLILKLVFILDNKGCTLISPFYYIRVSSILENTIGLHDKVGYFWFFMYSFFILKAFLLVGIMPIVIQIASGSHLLIFFVVLIIIIASQTMKRLFLWHCFYYVCVINIYKY